MKNSTLQKFRDALEEYRTALSPDTLDDVHRSGGDMVEHIKQTVLCLRDDATAVLIALGSGPVRQESLIGSDGNQPNAVLEEREEIIFHFPVLHPSDDAAASLIAVGKGPVMQESHESQESTGSHEEQPDAELYVDENENEGGVGGGH